MMTILTHQSAQYQGGDVLVVDGEKSVFSGTQAQLDALQLVRETSNPMFEKKVPWICKASGTSASLKIYITTSEKVIVSSNFLSKDEKGRNISYDFYCDRIDNPDKVVRIFADVSRIAGMRPNPSDLKTINKYLTFYKHRVRNFALLGAVALIVLLVLIKIII